MHAAAQEQARQPVPPCKTSFLVYTGVEKQKRNKSKKVFWKDADTGAVCPTEECTWTDPKSFDGDAGRLQPEWLVGEKITMEEQGTIYTADA